VASPIGSSDGTFTVLSGTGYPDGSVGPFVVVLDPGGASEEKVLCSGRSGTTFTVAVSGRGYDNTSAQAHAVGTTNVQHVFAAVEADDDNDHIYTTSRDDHTQYARTDGTRAITGTQHFSSSIVVATGETITAGGATITAGGLTVTAGGLSVASGTTAVQALTVAGNETVSGTLGVTGATTLTGGVSGAMAATGAVSGTTVTGTGEVTGTDMNATGLTGAVAGARFVGATTSGAPGSGTFVAGDFVVDQTGIMWVCTVGGTPGTWNSIGGVTDTAWTNVPSLSGSWVNSSPVPAYVRINGIVYLRGVIISGTINTAAFTLPAGYRPSAQTWWSNEFNGAFGYGSITPAGVVTPVLGSTGGVVLNCSFPTL
jgi:hypothetical protein